MQRLARSRAGNALLTSRRERVLHRRCGLRLGPSSFTCPMLRGSALPVTSLTAASRRAVCRVICRNQPTLKTSQQPGRALRPEGWVSRQRSKPSAVHGWVCLGRARAKMGFVTLPFPSGLRPQTCNCFYPCFYASKIWVNLCGNSVLNFGGNADC